MRNLSLSRIAFGCVMLILVFSCIKPRNLYRGDKDDESGETGKQLSVYSSYLYPFHDEVRDVLAEITIKTSRAINANDITVEIPYLKYNKSWLLMLTQDDCKQASYCRTWAVINGKPVANSELYPTTPVPHDLYYDVAQLQAGDLPPNIIPADKTLGSTDGYGNEVRFAITTTLLPEEKWMNVKTDVNTGFSGNYYRFYMKSGLIWDNVREMLNYGVGIAFHDVDADDVNSVADILKHYIISQDTILKALSGRGCKMLVEPNGNKTYIAAAIQYPDIQTITAQSGTVRLYPFKVFDDLKGQVLHRVFDTPENFKKIIESESRKQESEREAIHIGVHDTDNSWVEFLKWVNATYGKDGDNSVWFPSQEEYYEYNYYRVHGDIEIEQVDPNTIKLIVRLPVEKYFYYPSISINLKGISREEIVSISSGNTVTGFSYGAYCDGISMNIDCRKHLYTHAVHFVEQYEKNRLNLSIKADAFYFVNMLKDSPEKTSLLQRIL